MVSPGQGGDGTLIRSSAHKVSVTVNAITKTVGFTHGNLTITPTVNKRAILVAEYGTTPIGHEVTGVTCVVKWTMIEWSLKILDIALHGMYPINYQSATVPGTRGIGRSGIIRTLDRPATVLLHPLYRSDTNEDITLQQALITPVGSVELSDQNQRMWDVEADCSVLASASDGELLAILGATVAGA